MESEKNHCRFECLKHTSQVTVVPCLSQPLDSTGHVLLNAFDTSFVKITALLNNTYISANMPVRNAYAPVIRNDPDIKFLENNGDALATVISAILRRNLNDLVLIYDGETDLDFLTRQMKALYYTTFKLDSVWENNKERLKNIFKRKATGRSYVLLLNRTTLKETANQLLNYVRFLASLVFGQPHLHRNLCNYFAKLLQKSINQ
ncbi:unnamed protein product [Dibothriocephalus latus]|uniref:Uncharacterized protein n=1 Tax=Dibothriocephalus latus TaxID=60516 RepID=A0A3P7LM16_DIBLA|nr:unnamed protein product [Dibothriocephalus latus]